MYVVEVIVLIKCCRKKQAPCACALDVEGPSLIVEPAADGGDGWCLQNASQLLKHLVHGSWENWTTNGTSFFF